MPAAPTTASHQKTAAMPHAKTKLARPKIVIAGLLIVAILAIYAQVSRFDFVSVDDYEYVRDNDAVTSGLNAASIKWAFHNNVAGNWHPVTMLTHMLDCQIYGVVPGAHHFTNVLLHIANTTLLFFLLLRMTRKLPNNLWPCSLVAAMFALHPLHVESVAWISERKDVLSGFFFMLTLWAYVRYTELKTDFGFRFDSQTRNRCIAWYVAGLALFALGLMSKPMLVTLPCVLVLLDWWPLQRIAKFSWRAVALSVAEKIPFFVLTAIFSVITVHAQKSANAVVSFSDWPLRMRLATAVVAFAQYLGKTLVPTSLGVLYRHSDLTASQIVGATILVVSISLVALIFGRKKRYLFVGWFLFVGVMFPVSGIAQVGEQAFADRFTYLPHIGLFMAVAWGLSEIAALRSKLPIIVGALSVAYIPTAFLQAQHWSDPEALFNNSLRVAPNNSTAHHYLAVLLDNRGKTNEAFVHFSEAVHYNPNNVHARCGYAYALFNQNKFSEAAEQYQAALNVEPDNVKAHYGMAETMAKLHNAQQAIDQYFQVLKLKPDVAGAHYQIGSAMLASKQDTATALNYLETAAHYAPYWTDALNGLAWALATNPDAKIRKGDEAVQLASRAVSITRHNDAGLLDTLGAAYAEKGDFDKAVAAIEHAIQRAKATGQTSSIGEFESHLKSFQEKKPWRE
jgi:protein O-mannosyl-transferase